MPIERIRKMKEVRTMVMIYEMMAVTMVGSVFF